MRIIRTPSPAVRAACAAPRRDCVEGITGDNMFEALRRHNEPAPTTPATPAPPRGLKRAQFAAGAGMSARTVANWLQSERVRSVHISRRTVKIPEAELTRFLTLSPA